MKRILRINEQEFETIVKVLLEQKFEDEDYVHIFLNTFAKWMSEKYPNTFESKPLSFLLKTYKGEFRRDLGLGSNDYNTYGIRDMGLLGKDILMKGISKYASLRPKTKFLEKFGKKIDYFINGLKLPSYLKLNFVEELPYTIRLTIDLDFEKKLKTPEHERTSSVMITNNIERFIREYLGIEMGNPEHGDLEFTGDLGFKVNGFDEWIKTDYKKFRKEIKSLPKANSLQRVNLKLDQNDGTARMDLYFKDFSAYQNQKDYTQSVKDYAEQKGYNSEVLKIRRA